MIRIVTSLIMYVIGSGLKSFIKEYNMGKMTKQDIADLYQRKLELQQEIEEIDKIIFEFATGDKMTVYEPIIIDTIFLS